MKSLFRSKIVWLILLIIVTGVVFTVYMAFTNEGVATEFRQLRQPSPNLFYVGIDVSKSIDEDALEYLKINIIKRLREFIGEETVSYHIFTFGNPGCCNRSVKEVVSTRSPEDETKFDWEVGKKIKAVSIAKREQGSNLPLTTPLNCLLFRVLTERVGGRIIIFSDLMNDDSDCHFQYPFPDEAFLKFGQNKEGQIIFIYPTPQLTNTPALNSRILGKQQAFIDQVREMVNQGKVRAYFYHIPDDQKKKEGYLESRLEKAIPATTFEIIWERTTRVVDTIVSAVRG